MAHTRLTGRYSRRNETFLQEKAARGNEVSDFYRAMLQHNTYEAYLADVGQRLVDRPGMVVSPTSGRDEILYARRHGWIVDQTNKA